MSRSARPVTRALRAVTALALGLAGLVAAPLTAADARPHLNFVQLGDSYSAGNGTGSYLEKNCWRSPINYGAQVAAVLGARYTDVACSGGVVKDILQPRAIGAPFPRTATYVVNGKARHAQSGWERQARRNSLCGKAPQPDMYYTFTTSPAIRAGRLVTATALCQLMTKAQLAAVRPSTDAVFLTIGGNDVGFSSIVATCLVVRQAAGCRATLESAAAKLPQMIADTRAALAAVDRRARRHADIYLLSYPLLLDTATYGIPEALPTYDAGVGLRDLQVRGDTLQRELIAELNAGPGRDRFHFVAVAPAWGGDAHSLDPHVGADNSDAWLVPPLAPGRDVAEWMHPTLPGWTATAGALRAALEH